MTPNATPEKSADWAQLMDVYREAMGLVEEAADYLANRGETDKDTLPPLALTAFMSESTRLTPRLPTMMSWLMLQRAVAEKEITADEARKPEHRLRRQPPGLKIDKVSETMLPPLLVDLVRRSTTLYERIERLEQEFHAERTANPVQSMIRRIESEIGKP
jgi:regulator of CtrA degradation